MTPARASQACTAAGLKGLGAEVVGRQVVVTVAQYAVTTQTVVKRLGVPVTVSFGDGRGNVTLAFAAEPGQRS